MLTVDAFLDSVPELPPTPRNLVRLMELLDEIDVEIDQVADIIQYDPALTAQVMHLCNSSASGSASPATDIHEATGRIGFEEIFQMVTALSTAALIRPRKKEEALRAEELWRHSVTAALAGKLIAAECNQRPALTFTACILHDIGKVVLARANEAKYNEIAAEAERSQSPVFMVERSALGFDHAEVGWRLLERWRFPEQLTAGVRFHHDPAQASNPERSLAACAYLGNLIAYFIGYGSGRPAVAIGGRIEALTLVGMTAESIPRIMTRVFASLRQTQALLNLSPL